MSLTEELAHPGGGVREEGPPAAGAAPAPLTRLRIDALVLSDSPRLGAQDPDHVRLLAGAEAELPPITVHRPTLRVIDGAHRVRAARLNGRTEITALLLDCAPADAFVLSVRANVTHGLPLSRADRIAAASRIVLTHPHWSDSAVAVAAGISGKTVARIRAQSPAADAVPSGTRVGRDGRVRPVDSAPRRRHAAAILLRRPDAGLREVARATGLSPATVRDVRQRIGRGEDPVPGRYRTVRDSRPAAPAPAAPMPAAPMPAAPASAAAGPGRPRAQVTAPARAVVVDRHKLLAKLGEDPSLRHTEAGRRALRRLRHYCVDADSIEALGRELPPHWASEVADLARSCAATWSELAARLQQHAE